MTLADSAQERVEQWVLVALLAYSVAAVTTGPLRWGLGMVKLSPLIYVPQVLMLLTIPAVVVWEARPGFTPERAMTLMVVGFALMVGTLYTPLKQVAFGWYTLLPFWFGLACAEIVFKHWAQVNRVALYLWVTVLVGVVINNMLSYPWEGFSYSVGEVEVVSSREWENIGGGKRLAGFARASFDAGLQALLLGLIVALNLKSILLRMVVWGLSFFTIYLTTSKGVYNMFFVLTPLAIAGHKVPSSVVRMWPVLIGLIGLLMPMTPLFMNVNFYIRDEQLANLTFSFWDRLNDMWPNAWRLLEEHGHPLWGRGLGGVGTAQTYFEPMRFNAADNLFMYWFVIWGWIALPGFLVLLLRTLRLNHRRSSQEAASFCMLLATFVYGITANVVESGLFAIAAGMSIRFLFIRSDH